MWFDVLNKPKHVASYRLNRSHIMNVPIEYEDDVECRNTPPQINTYRMYILVDRIFSGQVVRLAPDILLLVNRRMLNSRKRQTVTAQHQLSCQLLTLSSFNYIRG